MKIAIAQLNPTVGDIDGNLEKVTAALTRCREDTPDLVVFSELFLTGYPPRDLLERSRFIEKVQTAVETLKDISSTYPETGIVIGAPVPTGKKTGNGLYNAAILIYRGAVVHVQHKSLLPTYDVFDEGRYFDEAQSLDAVAFKSEMLGLCVCEDAWNDPEFWELRNYTCDPIEDLARKGATLIINISASPFHVEKEKLRFRIIQKHAKKHAAAFVFVNQVGGNDELIFDGRSMCLDNNGNPLAMLPPFTEHVETVDLSLPGKPDIYTPQDPIESVHDALVLGVRDYLGKCGFKKAVLGLSGGIDSAVTCCLAAEAIGSENVLGVSMPSPYSSRGSVDDSRKLAENLGMEFRVIPISEIYQSYLSTLSEHFEGEAPDITEENIQARIRGNILMGLSNKFGHILLSTGNKSELAVGYCTMYGDMAGGLAVISDVPKTMVYELARHINRHREIIPETTIDKAPSAELRPDQKDQDSLPPYELLDRILFSYVDEICSLKEMLSRGYDAETVTWVIKTVDKNEYKRRQAPPGLRVTSKAFGMGRRMAIAARYEL